MNSTDSVLRGLVMIIILEEHADEHITQAALCHKLGDGEWAGLMRSQWDRFKLMEQGFYYPCSGAPHIANAATLMGQMGFMLAPGSRETKNSRYELTPLGKCLAKFLLQEGILKARSSGQITEEVFAQQWVYVANSVSSAFLHSSDVLQHNNEERVLRDSSGAYFPETTEWLFELYAKEFGWANSLKESL